MTPRLLPSLDQVDAEWLHSVLRAAGVGVPAIAAVRREELGHGNSSATVRVAIEYEPHDPQEYRSAPASVVCKFHSADPRVFETTQTAGIFIKEANMLKQLAAHSDARVPASYFVAVAEDGGEFNLVCEDLSAFCALGDQISGCSVEEARAGVTELAKLHRQFWNEPLLDALHWATPRIPLPPNAFDLLRGTLDRLVSAEECKIIERAMPRIYEWLEAAPRDRTLIHVDCRVDNMLFDHREAGPPKAYLIDFALVTLGDAVADVAYFLTSSLAPEDRLSCERDLLEEHTQVIASKDGAYTFERALQSYRENIVSSLYLTLFAAMTMPDTSHGQKLLTALLERNCAAVAHWG